ncbi:centriolin isoform X1 [Electrophorus electricus]|uniref:centriolin isoform X1 n=1 Tax=Electrophorus electricus TaxID=8005 RepID=UPI0015D008E8|nr:centriolin isoform X1 [Electrophorus electricus]
MESQRAPSRDCKTSRSPLAGRSRCLSSMFMKAASHLDLTGDREGADNDALSDHGKAARYDERKRMGTKYITEDSIKKLTKQENLSLLQSLNLSNTHGDKCLRYIENLDKCSRLQVLNLNNNSIEKIEKLEKLLKLHELHISNNRIQKIEGLEHMVNLQILNLANNNIEQVPLWLAKKLRSLQMLNLQNNKIFSLHEVAKLKLLQNLTDLTLVENPVSTLAHYRLFIVFHLRSLESLDGQRISDFEREQAHHRFHTEEIERLEGELEQRGAEVEQLQQEKAAALEELEKQEMLQHSLKQQSKEQQRLQEQLERELDTKSELLKHKTTELTRACQKQYELEQELAFHKIDAKFEPLPYYPSYELEEDSLPADSPYIGKARHKRNMQTSDTTDEGRRALPQSSSEEDAPEHALERAEERLQQLHTEAERTERQILKASEELHRMEEAASQKRLAEAEKEHLRQQLCGKIQSLGHLRQEAEALEETLCGQSAELDQAQGELEQLQSLLRTLKPQDPRHTHVKAQVASKSQLLAIMSRKQHELEGRLDDMLTRITKETQEIKDLEQQLTDGQIAANEALKRDLEDIISGLQEYLHGVNEQARRARSDCLRLQRANSTLERLLQDKEQQLGQLQEAAQNSEARKEELVRCQEELEALRKENSGLRRAQGRAGAYEAELQAQLREKGTEASKLRGEIGRLHRLSELEHSALQAEFQKERQAKESTLAQLQLAAEREMGNSELLQQLATLQREKGELMDKVEVLQNDLRRVRRELLCPDQVIERLDELRRTIASGPGVLSSTASGPADPLGESVAELQEELHRALAAAHRDRDEARHARDRIAREAASLRERLRNYQKEYQSVFAEAEHARVTKKHEEAELIRLREGMQEQQEQQYLVLQRLQETESERDRLLTELVEQDKQLKAEETQTQEQLQSMDLELQELRRSFTASDLRAADQLKAAKHQLRSLHSTVQKIGQERAEDAHELEESQMQAAEAMRELTKAEREIQALQELLQARVNVINGDSHSVPHSSVHQMELAGLNRALKRQQAQTKRLRDQLAQAKEDNSENLEELLEEIEALRGTLLQHSNYLSRCSEVPRSRGYWYYVPPYQNPPSLGSQGTQDSGLGSQPPPSTDKVPHSRGRQHKETRPHSSTGYWVYPANPHDSQAHVEREPPYGDSYGESDEDGDGGTHFTPPPGSVIYTMPPDGTPLPQGTVIYAPPLPGLSVVPGAVFYGPPPEGARLVYGPPPSSWAIPLIPTGTLLCNMPGHQDTERSLREAEQTLREQQSGRVVSEQDLLRLEEQRSELQLELKKLQRAVSQLRHHRKLLESPVSQTEEEQDVACLEKTLQKRKVQLREADHLLLELEAALKDTTAKYKESLERQSQTEQRLEETQRELEVTEQKTRDSAKHLVEAKQHLRDLQEGVKEQQRCKQDQEKTLQQIEKRIAARDAEFQEVNRKLKRASSKLEDLEKELIRTQSREEQLLKSCRDSEELQHQHKKELEQLNTQTLLQKEELTLLGRKLEQWREEEAVVRARVEQERQDLADVLGHGEEEAHSLRQRVQELHADIQALAVQKGEMDSQLSERKSRLAQCKKEEQQARKKAQDLLAIVSKHRAELKHVLEMIQLENGNLEGVKVQHRHKLDQLEKSQETLLQAQVELQAVQVELEQQTALREQQADTAAAQRSNLLEQCAGLEARRALAQRSLEEAEGGVQAAEAELLKLQEEVTKLKREHRHARNIREEINRDVAKVQQQLTEESEELNNLKENVAHSQLQLEKIRKEVEGAQREWDGLIKLQQEQKAQLQARTEKIQKRQQRADRLQRQLNELEAAVTQKQVQLEQQEEHMKTQQRQSIELEELHRRQQQKLQTQLQSLEGALAQRVAKMEQATAAVEDLEEKKHFLQAEHEHCSVLQDRVAGLEEELAVREARLRASTEEQREVRRELEACRLEFQHLQETLATERRRREALKSRSLTDRDKLLQAEKERERLQKELEVVDQAAQENHERSRHLQHELSSASQELLCLKHKLQSHGERCAHQREIKDTIHSLRAEIEAELDSSMTELVLQPTASSDTESLKENQPISALTVGKAAYNTNDEQWRGEVLRERLRQHEDHLKAQLRRSMFSQQETLSLRRQQTEGSIQGLRQRVDKLDQLLGKSSHGSSYLSDSENLYKYSCSDSETSTHPRSREGSC